MRPEAGWIHLVHKSEWFAQYSEGFAQNKEEEVRRANLPIGYTFDDGFIGDA